MPQATIMKGFPNFPPLLYDWDSPISWFGLGSPNVFVIWVELIVDWGFPTFRWLGIHQKFGDLDEIGTPQQLL